MLSDERGICARTTTRALGEPKKRDEPLNFRTYRVGFEPTVALASQDLYVAPSLPWRPISHSFGDSPSRDYDAVRSSRTSGTTMLSTTRSRSRGFEPHRTGLEAARPPRRQRFRVGFPFPATTPLTCATDTRPIIQSDSICIVLQRLAESEPDLPAGFEDQLRDQYKRFCEANAK